MFFLLLKERLQPYLSLIKLVVRGLVLLLIAFLLFMNGKYADEIRTYKTNEKLIEQVEKTHNAELNAQKAIIEKQWAEQRIQANEAYTVEIQNIHIMYADRLRDLGGVQYSAKEIIKYLPDYSRSTLENITTATANGVSECSTLLVEVEQVARGYSAEIDKIIGLFPKSPNNNSAVTTEVPKSREAEEPSIKPQPKPYLD